MKNSNVLGELLINNKTMQDNGRLRYEFLHSGLGHTHKHAVSEWTQTNTHHTRTHNGVTECMHAHKHPHTSTQSVSARRQAHTTHARKTMQSLNARTHTTHAHNTMEVTERMHAHTHTNTSHTHKQAHSQWWHADKHTPHTHTYTMESLSASAPPLRINI